MATLRFEIHHHRPGFPNQFYNFSPTLPQHPLMSSPQKCNFHLVTPSIRSSQCIGPDPLLVHAMIRCWKGKCHIPLWDLSLLLLVLQIWKVHAHSLLLFSRWRHPPVTLSKFFHPTDVVIAGGAVIVVVGVGDYAGCWRLAERSLIKIRWNLLCQRWWRQWVSCISQMSGNWRW